jgi:uncharacterized protein YndB with AHSA1/START domain
MAFTAKIQRTIHAPTSVVWAWLTQPERVTEYFFGTRLVTTWQVGSPIFFRGEWEGTQYEDRGTVLRLEPESVAQFSYLSSWSGLPDLPENYQVVTYRLQSRGPHTVLTITQRRIPSIDKKVHAVQSWRSVVQAMLDKMGG